MTKSQDTFAFRGRRKGPCGLDARYGDIGISALVAALRYQPSPTPKNPAYAEDVAETRKTVQDKAA